MVSATRKFKAIAYISDASHDEIFIREALLRFQNLWRSFIESCFIKHSLYRSALKGKGGSWTEGNLDKWLKSPADYAPGNSMAFAGIPNAKDRADLVAYLKTKTA